MSLWDGMLQARGWQTAVTGYGLVLPIRIVSVPS